MKQQSSFIKTMQSPLWLFVSSLLGLTILFLIYGIALQRSITTEVQTYLSEIANQSKNNISRQFQNRLAMVHSIAAMLDLTNLNKPEMLMESLQRQRGIADFKRFGLIFPDGRIYTTDNTSMDITEQPFYKLGLSGESGVSDVFADPVGGAPVHVYYVPVWGKNTPSAVFFAVSSNDSFIEMLNTEFFNATGYTHIVHKNGQIIRSNKTQHPDGHDNLFDILSSMAKKATIPPSTLLQNMRQNETGRFSYYANNKQRYVYYTPLDMNDWYLISSLPTDEVDKTTMQRLLWTFSLVGGIVCFLMIIAWQVFKREKGYKRTILSQMEELRTITANIPGGVQRCRHDEWLTMDYMSDGFVDMVGYTREELQNNFSNKFLPMLHSDDLFTTLRRIDTQLAKGNSVELEFRIIRSDGIAFWAHLKGLLVREGQEEFFYCVLLDETEIRTAMDILQMDAARYAVLFRLSDSILFEFDMRSGQVSTSPKYEETFGYVMPETNFPQSVLDMALVHPEDLPAFTDLFDSLYSGHREAETDVRVCKSSGEFIWCRIQVMGILDQNHVCTKAIGKITDIESQMQELLKLKEEVQRDPFTQLYNKVATETLAREAMDTGVPGALFLVDVDNFKRINDELGHAFGDTVLLTLATRLQTLFRRSDVVGRIGGDEFAVYLSNIKDEESLSEKADAICRIFSMPVSNGEARHQVSGSVGAAIFPTDSKDYATLFAKADKALYESKHRGKNCYTFYNKTLGSLELEAALPTIQADARTCADEGITYMRNGTRLLAEGYLARATIAVLAIKVTGLHKVNSVYGYEKGDTVLQTITNSLKLCLPKEALLARCRGNDFSAALPIPAAECSRWFKDFTDELSACIENQMADTAFAWVRIHVGSCLFPDQSTEFEQLNRKARQAVELCSEDKLVSHSAYNEGLTQFIKEQEELKHDLLLAVQRNEFELYFQPKVDPESKKIVSAEALIRWNNPERGQLAPADFIPLAEENKIIPIIDNWVISAACQQWRTLIDNGYPMVPMSINISHQKFYQANLKQVISDALYTNDISPSMLTIELTESCALADLAKAAEIMRELRELGLQTALDDFGTGCFTLSHLRDLPLDEVKVDRSLVSDDSQTASDSLRSLVNLVKVFKARVVFEGVETDEQYSRAGESGCDLVQGYFTGHPMPAEALGKLLKQQEEGSLPNGETLNAEAESDATPGAKHA